MKKLCNTATCVSVLTRYSGKADRRGNTEVTMSEKHFASLASSLMVCENTQDLNGAQVSGPARPLGCG